MILSVNIERKLVDYLPCLIDRNFNWDPPIYAINFVDYNEMETLELSAIKECDIPASLRNVSIYLGEGLQ